MTLGGDIFHFNIFNLSILYYVIKMSVYVTGTISRIKVLKYYKIIERGFKKGVV